jgi:hypothetical protein
MRVQHTPDLESWTGERIDYGSLVIEASDHFVQREAEPLKWLIKDLLPTEGLFVLSSPPQMGKTMLAIQLALSLASGHPFLGRPIEMRAKPLMITDEIEDWSRRLSRQQASLGLEPANVTFASPRGGRDDRKPIEWADLRSLVETGAGNVVLVRLKDITAGIDWNDNAAMMGVVREILAIVHSTHSLFVVLADFPKMPTARVITDPLAVQMRGAVALQGSSDGNFVLFRGEDGIRHLVGEMRDAPNPSFRLRFDPERLLFFPA